jgi:hypothetical protein
MDWSGVREIGAKNIKQAGKELNNIKMGMRG